MNKVPLTNTNKASDINTSLIAIIKALESLDKRVKELEKKVNK